MNSLCSIHTILVLSSSLSVQIFCTHPDLLTGKSCSRDLICSENQEYSWCNKDNFCECSFGYSFMFNKNENRMKCMKYKCNEKEDNCSQYWGPTTMCNHSLNGQCTCLTGQVYSAYRGKCVYLKKLGEKCDPTNEANTSICSASSHCLGGECHCHVGQISVNDQCELIRCKSNDQCEKLYPNTICSPSSGDCACEHGYKPDDNSRQCIRRLQKDECTFATECGKNAACKRKQCACLQGFESLENNWECKLIHCTTDKNCTDRNDYSYCESSTGQCKCSYSRSLDGSQCLKSTDLILPKEKGQESPQILYTVLYIAAGSIIIFVLSFIAQRFYPKTQRLNDRSIDGQMELRETV